MERFFTVCDKRWNHLNLLCSLVVLDDNLPFIFLAKYIYIMKALMALGFLVKFISNIIKNINRNRRPVFHLTPLVSTVNTVRTSMMF